MDKIVTLKGIVTDLDRTSRNSGYSAVFKVNDHPVKVFSNYSQPSIFNGDEVRVAGKQDKGFLYATAFVNDKTGWEKIPKRRPTRTVLHFLSAIVLAIAAFFTDNWQMLLLFSGLFVYSAVRTIKYDNAKLAAVTEIEKAIIVPS